ncbi:bifunctional hydroxymethylpyrimidine kinase/phosphomethylpyrimidine kinase, partial [Actinotalea ferrariae]|uniref:PfkB family carbohydrate kinase n=1 Tax=Actinotalea ferrariae TaxID=1386098 RepID=UPI001C8B4C46
AGARVVADGAPEDDDVRDALLSGAHVLRADAAEAALLLGREPSGVDETVDAARELQARGPDVVALAAGTEANVVAWDGGHVVVPLLDGGPTVDPTGGGDAFVAGLTAALLRGEDRETAAWWASAAAALTVTHAGGRPDYDPAAIERLVRRERGRRVSGGNGEGREEGDGHG